MKRKHYELRLIPEGSVVVTPKELEALNEHSKKVRYEMVATIFHDVEELLIAGMRVNSSCETLLADLQKIERKYKE